MSYIDELEVVNIVYAALLHQAIRKRFRFFMGIWVEPRVKTLVPSLGTGVFYTQKQKRSERNDSGSISRWK